MPFTPLSSLIGGFMLSAATSSLLAGQGRVLGISGIAHSVVGSTLTSPASKDGTPAPNITWKHAAFAGLLAGGALLRLSEGRLTSFVGASVFDGAAVGLSTSRVLLAGLAVGLGTKVSRCVNAEAERSEADHHPLTKARMWVYEWPHALWSGTHVASVVYSDLHLLRRRPRHGSAQPCGPSSRHEFLLTYILTLDSGPPSSAIPHLYPRPFNFLVKYRRVRQLLLCRHPFRFRPRFGWNDGAE